MHLFFLIHIEFVIGLRLPIGKCSVKWFEKEMWASRTLSATSPSITEMICYHRSVIVHFVHPYSHKVEFSRSQCRITPSG